MSPPVILVLKVSSFMSSSQHPFLADSSGSDSMTPFQLPLASMVRSLCRAATSGGPDLLYEVMLKMTLMVDSTAQTYGLATWTQKMGERPHLKWAEGLDHDEITEAEAVVMTALSLPERATQISAGDHFI